MNFLSIIHKFRGLRAGGRWICALAVASLSLGGCADPGHEEWKREQAMMGTNGEGLAHARWTSSYVPAGTWTYTVEKALVPPSYTISGTLFIDYANRQASGVGKLTFKKPNVPEITIEYKIRSLRLIREDHTALNDRTNAGVTGAIRSTEHPIVAIFEGEFSIYAGGKLFARSTAAYDENGPDIFPPSSDEPSNMRHLLFLSVLPAGIQVRDGIELRSFKEITRLEFRR